MATAEDTPFDRHQPEGFVEVAKGRFAKGPSRYAKVMYDVMANSSRITKNPTMPDGPVPSVISTFSAANPHIAGLQAALASSNPEGGRAAAAGAADFGSRPEEEDSDLSDPEDESHHGTGGMVRPENSPFPAPRAGDLAGDHYEGEEDEGPSPLMDQPGLSNGISESEEQENFIPPVARLRRPGACAPRGTAGDAIARSHRATNDGGSHHQHPRPTLRGRRERGFSRQAPGTASQSLEALAGFGPEPAAPRAERRAIPTSSRDPYGLYSAPAAGGQMVSYRGGGGGRGGRGASQVQRPGGGMPQPEDFEGAGEEEGDFGEEEDEEVLAMPPAERGARERFLKVGYLRELRRMKRMVDDTIPDMDIKDSLEDIEAVYVLHMSDFNDAERVDLAADVTWGTFGTVAMANRWFKVLNLKGMMKRLDRKLKKKSSQQLLYRISLALGKSGTTPLFWKVLFFVVPLVMGTHAKNVGWGGAYDAMSRVASGGDDGAEGEDEDDSSDDSDSDDERSSRRRRSSRRKKQHRKKKKGGALSELGNLSRYWSIAKRMIGKKKIAAFMNGLDEDGGGGGGGGDGLLGLFSGLMDDGSDSDDEEEASKKSRKSSKKSGRSSSSSSKKSGKKPGKAPSGGSSKPKKANIPKEGVSVRMSDADLDP